MMPVVRIPDELFARLQRHATPFVDTVASVVERILDEYERVESRTPARVALATPKAEGERGHEFLDFPSLWEAIAKQFNELSPIFPARPIGVKSRWKSIRIGHFDVHYEWQLRRSEKRLDVCLHFESKDRKANLRRLAAIQASADKIREGVGLEFAAGPWGDNWAEAKFRVPYKGDFPDVTTANRAAEAMDLLMDRTAHLLDAEWRPKHA